MCEADAIRVTDRSSFYAAVPGGRVRVGGRRGVARVRAGCAAGARGSAVEGAPRGTTDWRGIESKRRVKAWICVSRQLSVVSSGYGK